jgi:hypothetical protein
LKTGDVIALVDDRDMAHCLPQLRIGGAMASDEQLLNWLSTAGNADTLVLEYDGTHLPVAHIQRDAIAGHFGFVPAPQADAA